MSRQSLTVTLRAAILAFAVSFILLFVFAALVYRMPDVSDSLIAIFAHAPLAVSSLLCGITASAGTSDNPLIVGAVSGIVYFALLLCASAAASLITGSVFAVLPMLISAAVSVMLSLAGAFIGAKRSSSSRSHSKKSIMRSAIKRAGHSHR